MCVRAVRTVSSGVVGLCEGFGGVEEPLVAHVAFAAAEEDVGTLLLLHTLITGKDRSGN